MRQRHADSASTLRRVPRRAPPRRRRALPDETPKVPIRFFLPVWGMLAFPNAEKKAGSGWTAFSKAKACRELSPTEYLQDHFFLVNGKVLNGHAAEYQSLPWQPLCAGIFFFPRRRRHLALAPSAIVTLIGGKTRSAQLLSVDASAGIDGNRRAAISPATRPSSRCRRTRSKRRKRLLRAVIEGHLRIKCPNDG